ncbi:MAG: tRNA (adenosine(37)-N6)-threonylcarbamoyltransferase complex ATPase subunit type 1 TsaE [Desulfuromonadales bacterium]
MHEWTTITADPAETRALGRQIGLLAHPGLVVLLAGELGAGKTCFAQGVADGLGIPAGNPVTSPSYTLLNIHQGRLPLYHFDLYRLAAVDDLEDLGYDEIAEGDGVTLVEWADRLSTPLPASLRVVLSRVDAARRKLCFKADDTIGRELVAALAGAANTL